MWGKLNLPDNAPGPFRYATLLDPISSPANFRRPAKVNRLKGKIFLVTGILASAMTVNASADTPELPSFMPDYYSDAFLIGEREFRQDSKSDENGFDKYIYLTTDNSLFLSIQHAKCDKSRCKTFLENMINQVNETIARKEGEFRDITETEFYASIRDKNTELVFLSYVFPASIQIWTYQANLSDSLDFDEKYRAILKFADRQRYDDALSAGNVSMGHWGSNIHEHALGLLRDGKKGECPAHC